MAEQKTKAPKGGDKGQAQGGKAKGRGEKVSTLPLDPEPKVAAGKPRLQAFYESTVRPRLAKSFALTNPHQAAMQFWRVNGVDVHGNYQVFKTGIPMYGVKTYNSCRLALASNSYPNAAGQSLSSGGC